MPADAVPLEVQSLVKRYGDKLAVDDVTFSVPRGSVFCLLGPNGAGKTTTLEVAQGIRRATGGEARLFGKPSWDAPRDVRQRMGVLPQRFTCFPALTARENVEYFADIYQADADIDALLASLGLEEEADTPYMRLSGGTARRVAIATALVHDPELVFLDEPTAGVDPANRRRLWEIVERIRDEGRAVVLTTHYMDEAERLADDVAIIVRGRIVAHGSPEKVRLAHGQGHVLRVRGLEGDVPATLAARAGVLREVDGTLVVPLAEAQEAPLIIAELVKSGVAFTELSLREPTLDDAFVHLAEAAP